MLRITLAMFPSFAQANEFKNCVKQYESFVDEHLNTVPAPEGKERAKIAMKGFEELRVSHQGLSFDEIVKCASAGTVASNSKNGSSKFTI